MQTLRDLSETDFLDQTSSFEYVSFDVFDTLIFRAVKKPYDQLNFVPIIMQSKYNLDIPNFVQKRRVAENKARAAHNGKEVCIKDIYDYLDYDYATKNLLIQEECNVEINICIPNDVMVDCLKRCKNRGQKIIITTDMYLPRKTFEEIFAKIGIKYDRLFISCEEGVTKRSGDLFSVVLNKLSIQANKIVHIGDDPNNDIIQAQKKGIQAIERIERKRHVPAYFQISKKSSFLQEHFFHFLSRNLQNRECISSEFNIGYSVIGPLLWNFCSWIHEQKLENKLNSIRFVAREGFLICKIYQELFPMDDVGYIRLNKNLLRLPSLAKETKISNFINSIPSRDFYTLDIILNYLGIENHKAAIDVLTKSFPSLDPNLKIRRSELKSGKYDKILDTCISLQHESIEYQKNLLNKYLEQHGLLSGKIGLVNNSINGSGQFLIEEFLKSEKKDCNIFGLQFTKSKACESKLGKRYAAWLDDCHITSLDENRFQTLCIILEHMLFEPIGSALHFCESTLDGVFAKCENLRKEQLNFTTIDKIQEAALCFVHDFKNNSAILPPYCGLKAYLTFLKNPLSEDAAIICNLWDDDAEGSYHLSDLSTPFKVKSLKYNTLDTGMLWVEAYINFHKLSFIYRSIFKLRYGFSFYRKNRKAMILDFFERIHS